MNNIIINRNIHKALQDFFGLKKYSKIIVLADENTLKECYLKENLSTSIPAHEVIEIVSGEQNKNLRTCENIWQRMTDLELDRKSLVINLGGGVIGDMGGFCASTYKRGIDFIQIPTTLLSMVDASVGGKLGIDFHGFKNHLGVFNIPVAVIISDIFLKSLPANELRSGFAEIIKHCLIADGAMWQELLRSDWKTLEFEKLIKHSVEIKDKITTEDPTEKGIRKILNFGHTLGHAIETFYLETPSKLLHGEAIAIGMICESYLSWTKGLLAKEDLQVISDYILTIYEKYPIKETDFSKIIHLTRQDKKNQFQEVQFALIGPAGHASFDIKITEPEMLKALAYYQDQVRSF